MMSKDRVRFTIPEKLFDLNMFELATEAFGQHFEVVCGDITIICRPSQFARFLILRNNRGMNNKFKELNPQLEQMVTRSKVFDVSETSNTVKVSRLS